MKKYIFLFHFFSLSILFAQAQNVGIGTGTPAEKLHVIGNIKADTLKPNALKITTAAGANKVLKSDAVGNASWEENIGANYNSTGNAGFGVWGDCATNSVITEYYPVVNTPTVIGEGFGKIVAISGIYAVVGAPESDIAGNNSQGSASVFKFQGGKWVFMQKITDIAGMADDKFGQVVAISGNLIIAGSPKDDVGANIDQGSACIFGFNGSSWVLMNKLIDVTGAATDEFGTSVSIAGNFAIIGAPFDDVGANISQGSACIFGYNGSNWLLMNKLTANAGNAQDNFGQSVSISGSYAIVGVPDDVISGNSSQGSVKFYQLLGANWSLMNSINDATGLANDRFGGAVSISGNYAIIGVASADNGIISNTGAAVIYQYDGTDWVFMKKIYDPAGSSFDSFGNSVSISGNYVLIGALFDDVGTLTNKGSACIYQRIGNIWQRLQYITEPYGDTGEQNFGVSVSIDGTTGRFIIGTGNSVSKDIVFFGKVN